MTNVHFMFYVRKIYISIIALLDLIQNCKDKKKTFLLGGGTMDYYILLPSSLETAKINNKRDGK